MRKLLIYIFLLLTSSWAMAQTKAQVKYVNLDINTKGADYNATIYQDSLIVFTSVQKKEGRKISKSVDRIPYTDLYVATLIDSQVVNPRIFSEEFVTVFNEADATFTPDYQTVFYTSNNIEGKKRARQDDTGSVNLQILMSTINENGEWTEPEKLGFIQESWSYAQPSVSPDGNRLYFASNMPGAIGGSDIFYIELYDDGRYSSPINLGFNINSAANENFPSIEKNNELYFSSNRAGGFGGLDIYKSEIGADGQFKTPVPLDEPFNSEADDFGYKFNERLTHGFYSSNREGGKGGDDIYMFFEQCEFEIYGTVRKLEDADTLLNAMVYLYNKDSLAIDSVLVNAQAQYAFTTACFAEYQLLPEKNLYHSEHVGLSSDSAVSNRLRVDLVMDRIIQQEAEKLKIMIGPIYFNFDDSQIRKTPDGQEEMDRIVTLMNDNPSMVVEVSSYTDSRGDSSYNQMLSQLRAQSTVDYIVSQGIDSERIYGKGYGESDPVNGCIDGVSCTLEQYQMNRRTEFVVVSFDGNPFEQIKRTDQPYKEEEN